MKLLASHAVLAAAGIFFVFVSSVARADDADVRAAKEAQGTGPWQIDMRGGTGIGTFQDIQVPVNVAAGERADGTTIGQENQNHQGLPITGGIGYDWHPSDRVRWELIGIDGMMMRASTGPSETQSSTYSRVDAGSELKYAIPMGSMQGTLGVRLGVRRSSWTNVSAGHYLDSVIAGGSFGLAGRSASVELYGNAAPIARFGYSNQAVFGGSDFHSATASMFEAGAHVAFPLQRNVWLETGAERESVHVTINDITEYDRFGMTVDDPDNPTRTYDLETTVLRFGIRKAF